MGEVIQFNEVKKLPACAFCKKPASSKRRIIGAEGSPGICEECVEHCNKLIEESDCKTDHQGEPT